jgi:hypothetical protein
VGRRQARVSIRRWRRHPRPEAIERRRRQARTAHQRGHLTSE